MGLTLGGPIVENALFFFINYERERREDPGSNFKANRGNSGDDISRVLASDLDAVKNHLVTKYSYNPGVYEDYIHRTENDKFLIKLNLNIDQNHNAVFRYNYLSSFRDVGPHPAISASFDRGPSKQVLPFSNNSYEIHNNMNSFVGELNSTFDAGRMANKLSISYTRLRDFRTPWSTAFPSVDILDGNGGNYISFGQERFSTNNVLDSDVLQVSDNFNIFTENHVITFGFNFENFKFANSFNLFYYPGVTYSTVTDFLNDQGSLFGEPAHTVHLDSLVLQNSGKPYVNDITDVSQFAVYAQDEFHLTDDLTFTLGLRMDVPIYNMNIPIHEGIKAINFHDTEGNVVNYDTNKLPDQTPLWSPRFGFNMGLMDKSHILGGTGVFTGRIPFVWIANQVGQSEIDRGYTFYIHGMSEGFKFPQVWKSNLAYETELPLGINASVEFLYGKDINAVVHRNYAMKKPTLNAHGSDKRAIFAGTEINRFVPNHPDSAANTFLDAGMIVLENTDEGHQFNFTTQFSKTFGDYLFASVSYNYSQSKDITSNPGEIAPDAFQRLPIVGDPNAPTLSYSDWGADHRFVLNSSFSFNVSESQKTTVSLFGNIESGDRFSYVYAGDMNNDGISGNDLIYIPKDATEIALKDPTKWEKLNAFIEQDEYLSERRGQYAERNGAFGEFFTKFDLRILHDIEFAFADKVNTLQFSLDVLNVGNLINSEWGVYRDVHSRQPLSFTGYKDAANNDYTPVFDFDESVKTTFIDHLGLRSKWQIQFGVRYSFN